MSSLSLASESSSSVSFAITTVGRGKKRRVESEKRSPIARKRSPTAADYLPAETNTPVAAYLRKSSSATETFPPTISTTNRMSNVTVPTDTIAVISKAKVDATGKKDTTMPVDDATKGGQGVKKRAAAKKATKKPAAKKATKKPAAAKKATKNAPAKKKTPLGPQPETKKTVPTKRQTKAKLKATAVKPSDGDVSLINKAVCFDISTAYGLEIPKHIGVIPPDALVHLNGKEYIYGAIAHHKDAGKYTIEFENSDLKRCVMNSEGVIYGISLALELAQARRSQEGIDTDISNQLAYQNFITSYDQSETVEHPLDSDEESLEDDDDKANDPIEIPQYHPIPQKTPFRFDPSANMTNASCVTSCEETRESITWRRDTELGDNPQKSCFGKTRLKSTAHSKFDNPLNSLLAFLPIPIWETMLKESNRFAHQKCNESVNNWISGHPWSHDLNLTELMTFISILVEMTLHPTPGRSYTHMWKHEDRYPFTKSMTITRFRQVRSILHLCNNELAESDPNQKADPLSKIRPLLNILKSTLPEYLDVGDELALDEASVASKSRFGRFLIMFNPMKPGGKFHYRFYFVCDSDHFNLLRFSMHTRNNADLADGFNIQIVDPDSGEHMEGPPANVPAPPEDTSPDTEVELPAHIEDEDIEEEVEGSKGSKTNKPPESKITKLLLDLLRPFNNSFRTVNMDRFYNGPQQAVAMLSKGLLCRGTFMTNRKFTPHSIRFSKSDSKKHARGSYRMACSIKDHMSIFGWNDGCGVHMLSTADGTQISSVERQIGSNLQKVNAPIVVRRYNQGMQGVDRHDQLRTLFSLATRHQFQKYYMTLIMALIDFALVNAHIHYHMAHPALKKSKEHRANFMQILSDSIRNANWHALQSNHHQRAAYRNQTHMHANIVSPERSRVRNILGLSSETDTNECILLHGQDTLCRNATSINCNPRVTLDMEDELGSKAKMYCQVCQYEGRGRVSMNVTYCYKHCIRACCKVQDDIKLRKSIRFPPRKAIPIHGGMDFSTWMCQEVNMTCWEKMHTFYLPHEIFTSVKQKEGSLPIHQLNRLSPFYIARNDFTKLHESALMEPSDVTLSDVSTSHSLESPRRRSPRHQVNSPQSFSGIQLRNGSVLSPSPGRYGLRDN